MTKVLLTKPFFEEDLIYIKARLDKEISLVIPSSYSEEDLIKHAGEAKVLMGGFISERLIDAAKNLSFIQIPWTGVDNLNFDLLRRKNIVLCNSHSNAMIVAEHAIALMMDSAKKISYHDRLLREGKWNRASKQQINEISPFSAMINHSNVCIIGYGAIGQKIHQLLSGFECQVTAITRDLPMIAHGNNFKVVSDNNIFEHLKRQKFVLVSVPLTTLTKGMIDKTFFEAMEKDSALINISRGEVLDEEALYNALVSKTLAFAAIDTWFNYPTKENPEVFPSKRFPFHKLNNLVLSPHRAGYAEDGFPHLDDAIKNINNVHVGLPLMNIVDLEKKY